MYVTQFIVPLKLHLICVETSILMFGAKGKASEQNSTSLKTKSA